MRELSWYLNRSWRNPLSALPSMAFVLVLVISACRSDPNTTLFDAIKNKNVKQLEESLAKGANPGE